ncbi:YbaB/EbfC family nucleoid-associated protein [Streptosporangium subroseum]|uniref:YbaB/EbfC family nucleoid-associated protein n=1 Tax=Streptosporangium subroseum TaxID=106412 RepID=UPI0034236A66
MNPNRQIAAFGSGKEGDVPELLREVNGWLDGFTGALRELNEQEVEGRDADGQVLAKVTGSGRLLSVAVDPRAMRALDHVALGEAVCQAIQGARAAAATAMAETIADLTGQPMGDPSDVRTPDDPLAPYIQALLGKE